MSCFPRLLSFAVVFLAISTTALAATKPAIVQNIDEPARAPYQEGVFTFGCLNPGDCDITFQTVPAGVRRVIEHISCFVATNSPTNVSHLTLVSQSFRTARNTIPLSTDGSGTSFYTDAATLAYFDAGEIPRVDIFVQGALATDFLCTLVGHDITLP